MTEPINEDALQRKREALESLMRQYGSTPCPRCGEPYPTGYGAASRWDTETEVCPDCGLDESMYGDRGDVTVFHPVLGRRQWRFPPERAVEDAFDHDEVLEALDFDTEGGTS